MNLAFLPARVGKILSAVGKGNAMMLRRTVRTDYDPYWSPEENTTDYPCEGVIMKPRISRRQSGSETVRIKRVLIRADTLPVTPVPGDELWINGVRWTVAVSDRVQPAGTAILHKLELTP